MPRRQVSALWLAAVCFLATLVSAACVYPRLIGRAVGLPAQIGAPPASRPVPTPAPPVVRAAAAEATALVVGAQARLTATSQAATSTTVAAQAIATAVVVTATAQAGLTATAQSGATATSQAVAAATATAHGVQTVQAAQAIQTAQAAQATATRAAGRREFAFGAAIADASDAPGRSFDIAREAGFTHAYVIVRADNVLRDDGRFAWEAGQASDLDNFLRAARGQSLRLVLRIDRPRGFQGSMSGFDPGRMEQLAAGVAERARDVADAYEILNEPNLPAEWGGRPDPAGYARLLAAAGRGIKRSDPEAVVIAAGLSPHTGGQGGTMEDVQFLHALYAAGGKGAFDALGAHAYGGSRPPDADPGGCGLCFRRVELYRRAMDERGDVGIPIWITEFGYLHTTGTALGPYDWMKVSANQQADYLSAAYRYARGKWPWLGGMVLFNLDFATVPWNPPTSGAHWFSVLNPDRSPRPALAALGRVRAEGS